MNQPLYSQLQAMENLLTEEDCQLLSRIYEPTIVAVPPMDTRNSICVMPDGEIRVYGYDLPKENYDDWSHPVYLASRDCGISWKKHLVQNICAGSGTRIRNGKYISVVSYFNSDTGFFPEKMGIHSGTYAVISDSPADEHFRLVKISDERIFDQYLPIELANGRIACSGQIRDNGVNHCIFMWSDDLGETWDYVRLADAPVHQIQWPHKSIRWQNRTSECSLTERGDGSLWILARTSLDDFWEFFSYDKGNTWEGPFKSPFHGTLTSPKTMRLSDGRLLCCFNNTQPLPELDKTLHIPLLNEGELTGRSEDVFTNRDANHAAISDDDGKTWKGFREMALNVIRNDSDYRTKGPVNDSRDKSVHQFQMLELPMHKVLVSYGQNQIARKLIIFDLDWLLETERHENFRQGVGNVSTQVYLKSLSGNFRMAGHCSWNRTHGAVLLPDPEGNFEEALFLSRIEDPRLFCATQGMIWNFPACHKGQVRIRLRVDGAPIHITLTDRWFNPIDDTLPYYGAVTFSFRQDMLPEKTYGWCEIHWDQAQGSAKIYVNDILLLMFPISGEAVNGLSYLCIQSTYEGTDTQGAWIKELHAKALH